MAVTNTLGYSFAQGLILFVITVSIGWFTLTFNKSFTAYCWLVLPIISYLLSFGVLSFVNSLVCGKTNFSLVATSSVFTLAAVIFFLILSYFNFFQNFIIPIVPVSVQQTLGPILATGFFIFWAGMYGGAFGYGFAQGCPNKS